MYRYIFAALIVGETQQLQVGYCYALSHEQAIREAKRLVANGCSASDDIYVTVMFDEEYHQKAISS